MEILRGAPALSGFRVSKLLRSFEEMGLPIRDLYAEFVHFADLSAPLDAEARETLGKLLTYGPTIAEHAPTGLLFLVTPRPGTISPWSSKAAASSRFHVWNAGLPTIWRRRRSAPSSASR